MMLGSDCCNIPCIIVDTASGVIAGPGVEVSVGGAGDVGQALLWARAGVNGGSSPVKGGGSAILASLLGCSVDSRVLSSSASVVLSFCCSVMSSSAVEARPSRSESISATLETYHRWSS